MTVYTLGTNYLIFNKVFVVSDGLEDFFEKLGEVRLSHDDDPIKYIITSQLDPLLAPLKLLGLYHDFGVLNRINSSGSEILVALNNSYTLSGVVDREYPVFVQRKL